MLQVDLADMVAVKKENDGYQYLFVGIDIFSKFVYCIPIKTKTGKNCSEVLEKILIHYKTMTGRSFKFVQSDHGLEFYNKYFEAVCKKFNVHHYSTYSDKKASICERVIRTLKQKIYKNFTYRNSLRYLNWLNEIIQDYNFVQSHSKHKTTPYNAAKPKNEKRLVQKFFSNQSPIMKKMKFKVGDFVRISKFKKVFDRGFTHGFSPEVFRVAKVYRKFPGQYKLIDLSGNDIQGGFYKEELTAVADPNVYLVQDILKRKNGKVLVQWYGFPKSQATWEDENNILPDTK